jgi:hypothetical protein
VVQISYKSGYKYQLTAPYSIQLPEPFRPAKEVSNRYVRLTTDGVLTLREDYAWNGADGPTLDTASSMRGSLVHDGIYQLMREGLLDYQIYRQPADRLLCDICVEDGMSPVRAKVWYDAVRAFGGPRAKPAVVTTQASNERE